MTAAKTMYLVRHGQTPWTNAERVQGWAPVPLNDTGREQLRKTGAYLADRLSTAMPVRIESSGLRRATESAQVIQDCLGGQAALNERERLRERDFGVLQGLDDARYHQLKAESTTAGPGAMLDAPERGESWREVETRVLQGWAAIVDEMADDESRVVVSHTGPIYCVLASVTGRRLAAEMSEMNLPEASLFEISLEAGESRLAADVWTPE